MENIEQTDQGTTQKRQAMRKEIIIVNLIRLLETLFGLAIMI